jgi:parallel beta-helix repeat protein
MSSRFVMPFANVGDGITPADGAKLQFYASGTSTPKDTYSDEDLTTANANPVVADADGVFGDIWMNDGDRYKVVLYDKNDVQIWDSDPVIGGLFNGASGRIYNTVAAMKSASPSAGQRAVTLGYYAAGDGYGAEYLIAAAQSVDGYGDHTLANSTVALIQVPGAVNVCQYGAKGDGATDDSSAIQAAVAAHLSVYFPAGNYVISSSIAARAGSHFYGDGFASVITFSGTMASTVSLRVDAVDNVLIENLKFAGDNSVSGLTSVDGCAVYADSCSGFAIRNCAIDDFPSAGVTVNDATDFSISNNTITNIIPPDDAVMVAGINVEDDCSTGVIDGNIVHDIGLTGTSGGLGIRIIVQNGTDDIPTNISVIGNDVKNCQTHGIIFYDNTTGGSDSDSVIGMNKVKNTGLSTVKNTGNGIYCLQTRGFSITGNFVNSSNSATGASSIQQAGISVVGEASPTYGVNITGNTVMSDGIAGIAVSKVTVGAVISGNTVSDCLGSGIEIYDCQRFSITGNTIFGASMTNGIYGHQGSDLVFKDGSISGNSIKNADLSIKLEDPDEIAVTGNVLSTYTTNGIFITDGLYTSVIGNTFASASAVSAIKTTGTHVYSLAANNTIKPNSGETHPSVSNSSSRGDEFKVVGQSQAVPTTGTWGRGDTLYTDNVSAGGTIGWVCTTSGTPGTWKTFGSISA